MAILAQGTHVYFIDPDTDLAVQIECATTFDPGGNPADQIDTTCLEDSDRSFEPGLRTPGQASLGLNADPRNDSHIRLHELSEDNPPPTLKWAIGWSDGTAPPTVDSSGDFDLPTSRTWLVFNGYVADFPFNFTQNTVVTSEVSIQRSGGLQWIKKVVV